MATSVGTKVGRMLPHEIQLANERNFNRKYIDRYIRLDLEENPKIQAIHTKCVDLLEDWSSRKYYPRKDARLLLLRDLDFNVLVQDVMVGLSYYAQGELFSSVVAKLANRVRFSDKKEAVETMAEVITVMGITGIFSIYREGENSNIMIKSLIPLSNKIAAFAAQTSFMPPMTCIPNEVTSNFSSGLLDDDTSVLMGRKHHDYPISLDVVNTQNQVGLHIDTDFMSTCEELPNKPLDSVMKQTAWNVFVEESREMCALLSEQSDAIYFNHGMDTRGRLYCHGYHLSYQGNPYRKSVLEFHTQEVVECPTEYQLKES